MGVQPSQVNLSIAPKISVVHEADDTCNSFQTDLLNPVQDKRLRLLGNWKPTASIVRMMSQWSIGTSQRLRDDPDEKLGVIAGL